MFAQPGRFSARFSKRKPSFSLFQNSKKKNLKRDSAGKPLSCSFGSAVIFRTPPSVTHQRSARPVIARASEILGSNAREYENKPAIPSLRSRKQPASSERYICTSIVANAKHKRYQPGGTEPQSFLSYFSIPLDVVKALYSALNNTLNNNTS